MIHVRNHSPLAFLCTALAVASAACTDQAQAEPGNDVGTTDTATDGTTSDVAPDADTEPRSLNAQLQAVVDASDLPSLVAGVADGTQILAMGVAGVRAVDGTDAVVATDPYHLGSNTKAMTATLVARYVEQGLLRWDSTVAELFPDLTVDAGFDGVTIADLLSHTGGGPASLAEMLGQERWLATFTDDTPLDAQRAAITAEVLGAPPTVSPGTFTYSNAGYVIAGAALERLTGDTWEALMQAQLFAPLGMETCGFGPPRNTEQAAPAGHISSGPALEVAPAAPYNDNPAFLGPAGTAYCNAASWMPFLQAHLRADDGDYLSAASWDILHTPNSDGYALGWGVGERSWGDGVVYSHAGSNTLWFTIVWIAPQVDRIYFAMTNVASEDTPTVADGVIGDMIVDNTL